MFSYFLRLIWLRDGSFHTLGVWDCFLLLSASELSLVPGWRSAASPRLGRILHKETRIRRRSRVMGKYQTARRLNLNLFSGGPCDYCVSPSPGLRNCWDGGLRLGLGFDNHAMFETFGFDAKESVIHKDIFVLKEFIIHPWQRTRGGFSKVPANLCFIKDKLNHRPILFVIVISISVQWVGVEVACLISRMLFD